MLSLHLGLFLVILLVAFILAWRLMPAGWLTAWTGTLGAAVIALHESVSEALPELRMLVPEEHRAWLVVLFLLLTVAARFRNGTVSR